MKPYYSDKWVEIYNADCREILSTLDKVGAVVTDPPYGLGELSGTMSKERNRNDYKSEKFEDTREFIVSVVIPALEMALKVADGRGILTPGVRSMFLYPEPRAIGGFYQPAAVGMCPWGFSGYNPVLFYGKDPRSGKGQSSTMTTLTAPASSDEHPCAKPLPAMLWMVNKASLEGETVLDPFMGSGTMLRAAKDIGRKAIGIEWEERFCEVAAKRMAQEVFDFKG